MGLKQLFSRIKNSDRGIALFMVIMAMTILSVIVTELTYVSQLNSRLAYENLNQLKAMQLAKTGLKISLLRLKAYQTLKSFAANKDQGVQIPANMLNQVWSMPFIYPFPTDIPGLDATAKESINKFMSETGLEGSFTALIESESSKYNLNSILAPFAYVSGTSSKTSTATGTGTNTSGDGENGTPPAQPNTATATGTDTSFNVDAAREALTEVIKSIIDSKFEADPDFEAEHRDFRLDDLMDGIIAYADASYERRANQGRETIRPKKAPFYTVGELRLVFPIDDQIYSLLAPSFTAITTPGINVNTMKEPVLRMLVPGASEEDVKEFFKYRDDPKEDHSFKTADDFYNLLKEKVSKVGGDKGIESLKESLKKRRIEILVDESVFRITIRASVNNSTRTLEAWVTLLPPKSAQAPAQQNKSTKPDEQQQPTQQVTEAQQPNSGLRITFMRFL